MGMRGWAGTGLGNVGRGVAINPRPLPLPAPAYPSTLAPAVSAASARLHSSNAPSPL